MRILFLSITACFVLSSSCCAQLILSTSSGQSVKLYTLSPLQARGSVLQVNHGGPTLFPAGTTLRIQQLSPEETRSGIAASHQKTATPSSADAKRSKPLCRCISQAKGVTSNKAIGEERGPSASSGLIRPQLKSSSNPPQFNSPRSRGLAPSSVPFQAVPPKGVLALPTAETIRPTTSNGGINSGPGQNPMESSSRKNVPERRSHDEIDALLYDIVE